jgi:hypothetical protein
MSDDLEIKVKVLRMRFVGEAATGEKCEICDEAIYTRQFRPIFLMEINGKLTEDPGDFVFCQPCYEFPKTK